MNFELIEQKAVDVLTKKSIESVPIPLEKLISAFDIILRHAPHEEYSGILIRSKSRALLGVNSLEPVTRQRFTIAHELGHYFLHDRKSSHYFVDDEKMVDCRFRTSKNAKAAQEAEANVFAAALLMPRDLVAQELKKISKKELGILEMVFELANLFNVSQDAMSYRLRNLNLVA